MNDISELKWTRVFTPVHIPKYLVEQVRHREYEVEDFYTYHEGTCTQEGENGFILNPFSHLYVLRTEDNEVKGFLWLCVDPLTKNILVQTYSIDKSYWNKGQAVKKLADFVKEIKRKGKLKKVYWLTNYPKHSMRYGYKRSQWILMEYNEEKEDGLNTDGEHESPGKCEFINSGATIDPERSTRLAG